MKQKGFTFVELLVAMGVGGILLTGIVLAAFQVSWSSTRSSDQIVALADIDYAALWLKRDLQMAQSTDLADEAPPQSSVTLSWTDYTSWATEETRDHTASYALSGTELRRTYDGTDQVIGRQISYIGFSRSGTAVKCVITATGPEVSQREETAEFTVKMRTEVFE